MRKVVNSLPCSHNIRTPLPKGYLRPWDPTRLVRRHNHPSPTKGSRCLLLRQWLSTGCSYRLAMLPVPPLLGQLRTVKRLCRKALASLTACKRADERKRGTRPHLPIFRRWSQTFPYSILHLYENATYLDPRQERNPSTDKAILRLSRAVIRCPSFLFAWLGVMS